MAQEQVNFEYRENIQGHCEKDRYRQGKGKVNNEQGRKDRRTEEQRNRRTRRQKDRSTKEQSGMKKNALGT